jgi:serine/threonine protein kinase
VNVYIFGKEVDLDSYPYHEIGDGAEGTVYSEQNTSKYIIKILKPNKAGIINPSKIQKIQYTIKNQFWRIDTVSFPQFEVLDSSGNIIGYIAKRFVGYDSFISITRSKNLTYKAQMLLKLYDAVKYLHSANIVIGDFNHSNFLVSGDKIALIDTDAWGYDGGLPDACKFVYLPKECLPKNSSVVRLPLNRNSDWYGFTYLLFNCMFGFSPFYLNRKIFEQSFDGKVNSVCSLNISNTYSARSEHLAQFHSTLLKYFIEVFECGKRGEFPRYLLEQVADPYYSQYVARDTAAKHLLFQNYPGTKIGGKTTTVNKVTPVVTPNVQPTKVPIGIPQQYMSPKTISTKRAKIPRPVKKPTPIVSSSFHKNYTPSVNQAKSSSSKAQSPKIAIPNILSQFGSIHTWKTKHQVLIWSCMLIGLMVSFKMLSNDIKLIMSTMNNMIEKYQEIKSNEK